MTFKERVRQEIIKGSAIYKMIFIDYEYLIYSKDFNIKPYYIISAAEDNYPHLTGVNILQPAQDFYDLCINGAIKETDFNFANMYKTEKEVIGSVRRKIQVLPLLATFFSNQLQAEEDFTKGNVHCSLATADNALTIGFVDVSVLRPKTLLKKNELNSQKATDVTLILRRTRGNDKFDTIIQGDIMEFSSLYKDVLYNI